MESKLKTAAQRVALVLAVCAIGVLALAFILGSMGNVNAFNIAQSGQDSAGWTSVYTETFETGDLSASWVLTGSITNPNLSGEYYWATSDFVASEGTTSVWAVGGGADGSQLSPISNTYPSFVRSSMTMSSAVPISGATQIQLVFDHWLSTESTRDLLTVNASIDGFTFQEIGTYSGDAREWGTETISLNQFSGEKVLWVQFVFTSDVLIEYVGVFLDNIAIQTKQDSLLYIPAINYDFTPTPTSTPTPTPTPIGIAYEFKGDLEGWEDRQRSFGESAESEVSLVDDEYMRIVVVEEDDYHIIAPLDELPEKDYRIDTRFRFANGDKADEDEFTIVFGADWDDMDDDCPDNDLNTCFTKYYVMRLRWRNEEDCGSEAQIQVTVGRVDGLAGNNLAYNEKRELCLDPDASGVNPNDWIEASIVVEADNDIKFAVNDTFYDSDDEDEGLKFTDRTYQQQPLFGVMVKSPDNREDLTVDVDYFRIYKP